MNQQTETGGPDQAAEGGERFESTSDQRTVNNAMRHTYRTLTDAEKGQVQRIKDQGAALIAELHAVGGTDPNGDRFGSRELALAGTKIEEAVFWAVKHVTR